MKPLSSRATELLNALRRQPDFLERLTGRTTAEDARLLSELRSHPEPGVVPHLLPFLLGAPSAVAYSAAEVLTAVLDVASPEDLLDLDEACRRESTYTWRGAGRWRSMKPLEVSRFEDFGAAEVGVVGIASFHANGYVREAAVTRLDAFTSGRELPFLLIRLNDWVAPVAERARAAVERRMVSAYAAPLVDNFPHIARLGSSRRRDHGAIIDRTYDLLQQPEQRGVLLRGLGSPDRRARRLCFRLARSGTTEEHIGVLRRALTDNDTVIRLEAVADGRRALGAEEVAVLLPIILADPFPSVRREGLALAAERLPDEAIGYLRAALLDGNQAVREVSRFFLRRRGEITDFACVYRAHVRPLARTRELASALAGLGETGTRADSGDILAYCSNASPSVRRAAIRALGMLDGDGQLQALVQALRDASSGVSRAARDHLRRRAGRVAGEVHAVLCSTAPSHARRYALSLLCSLGKWDSLPYLLEAAADLDPQIRTIARARLDTWVVGQNRSSAQPTSTQLQSIQSAFDGHHAYVDRHVAGEVRAILHFWGA